MIGVTTITNNKAEGISLAIPSKIVMEFLAGYSKRTGINLVETGKAKPGKKDK